MPLYAYRCTQCGHRLEKIQSFGSAPLTECPKCHGLLERPLTAPALQFKGAGWYVNDYAGKGKPSSDTSSPDSSTSDKPASDKPSSDKSSSEKSVAPASADSKSAAPESKPASSESSSRSSSSSPSSSGSASSSTSA
ncbi:MAG: FmdB family zinc ribbon protein [Terracidiphilus sp.]